MNSRGSNPRVADDVMDFDPDAPEEAPDPVLEKSHPWPVPDTPAGAPPEKKKAPSTSAKRGGRSKLLSAAGSEFDCSRFVNLARDLQRWAVAAGAKERAGQDVGLHWLRRFCALKREFLRSHGVNLTHPVVGATANVFLRRRDLAGLRGAMRQIVLRELATASLRHARRDSQPTLHVQRS